MKTKKGIEKATLDGIESIVLTPLTASIINVPDPNFILHCKLKECFDFGKIVEFKIGLYQDFFKITGKISSLRFDVENRNLDILIDVDINVGRKETIPDEK